MSRQFRQKLLAIVIRFMKYKEFKVICSVCSQVFELMPIWQQYQ